MQKATTRLLLKGRNRGHCGHILYLERNGRICVALHQIELSIGAGLAFGRCRATIRCTAGAIQTIPTHKSIQGCSRCLKTNPTSNEDGAPSMYSRASIWLSSCKTVSSDFLWVPSFRVMSSKSSALHFWKETGEVGTDQVIHQLIKARLLCWIALALSFPLMETFLLKLHTSIQVMREAWAKVSLLCIA